MATPLKGATGGKPPTAPGGARNSPARTQPRKGPALQVSGEYFQLVPQGDALVVVKVPPEKVKGASGAVLTWAQLEELLRRNAIPTVTSSALSGYLASLHALPGFESHAPGPFSQEPGMTPLSRSGWRGRLGELSAQRGGVVPQQDLNALRHNHPIFDLRDYRDGLNSVKTSVRSADVRGEPFETYLRGLRDVVGLRAETYAAARESLYPQLTPAAGEARMMRNGYLSVNEDHVEPFRRALREPDNYRKPSYREIADKFLELEPIRLGGTVYRSYQNLENARRGRETAPAVRQQLEQAMRALREKIASKVRGNGLTSQHLVRLEQFRQQVAAANPQMTPAQIERWVFPELLLVARHGGGVRGNVVASSIAGGRGAAGGAMVTLVCETGHLFYEFIDDQHGQPEMVPRLLKAAAAGGTSGLVGGATQSFVTANAGSSLSRNLISQGASARVATSTGRAVGGFTGGALAAPVFTMTSLALDDEEHSRTDYVATGTRAFVSGGISSAVAAGVVGAIWGSEVPVLGNAVGFIIGFAGYYVVDALTGEQVEQGVRRTLDDQSEGRR